MPDSEELGSGVPELPPQCLSCLSDHGIPLGLGGCVGRHCSARGAWELRALKGSPLEFACCVCVCEPVGVCPCGV